MYSIPIYLRDLQSSSGIEERFPIFLLPNSFKNLWKYFYFWYIYCFEYKRFDLVTLTLVYKTIPTSKEIFFFFLKIFHNVLSTRKQEAKMLGDFVNSAQFAQLIKLFTQFGHLLFQFSYVETNYSMQVKTVYFLNAVSSSMSTQNYAQTRHIHNHKKNSAQTLIEFDTL